MAARHTWLLIASIAGLHDYLKPGDQLTDEIRRVAVDYPIATRIALGTLALHLSGDLPRYLDPISGLGWLAARVRVG